MFEKIYLVSGIVDRLPFSLEDASRTAEEYEMKDAEGNKVYNSVGLDTRLNNRVLDLRVCLRAILSNRPSQRLVLDIDFHQSEHLSYPSWRDIAFPKFPRI